MNDRKRRELTSAAAQTLARTARGLADQTTVEQLHKRVPGPAAMRFDQPVVAGSGTSDPTARAALGHDRTAGQLEQLDRLITRAHDTAHELELVLSAYGPPRGANDADRLALTRANTKPEPGCESCARLEVAPGVNRWEPIDSRRVGPTTVGGRLANPMQLCSWCVDRVSLWDRLPTKAELETHHAGRRVPWPKDVARPA